MDKGTMHKITIETEGVAETYYVTEYALIGSLEEPSEKTSAIFKANCSRSLLVAGVKQFAKQI
jgi:hypothetical protein